MAGLAQALATRGHTVHLFTTTPNPSALPGVTIHRVRTAMIGEVAAPLLWRVAALRALLLQQGVQVVHAHGMFSTLAIGSLLAAHGAGIPSVTTHHSLLRQSPTLPAAWLTYGLFSRRATVVTAVSRAAAEDARRASGRADVPVLPNGFDPTVWRSDDFSLPSLEPRKRVVSVMRLAARKSPGDLIDAVPLVLSRIGPDVVFTIVGDGPERPNLERRAQQLGVARHVEFLGACDQLGVAQVLRRSTVFALPSRREAFGIALLEARAAGLPIVARDSGGVPEVVEHGRHGLLTRTSRDFADAVVTLLTDETLRQRIAAASSDGLAEYSWDRVVARHEDVYRQVAMAPG